MKNYIDNYNKIQQRRLSTLFELSPKTKDDLSRLKDILDETSQVLKDNVDELRIYTREYNISLSLLQKEYQSNVGGYLNTYQSSKKLEEQNQKSITAEVKQKRDDLLFETRKAIHIKTEELNKKKIDEQKKYYEVDLEVDKKRHKHKHDVEVKHQEYLDAINTHYATIDINRTRDENFFLTSFKGTYRDIKDELLDYRDDHKEIIEEFIENIVFHRTDEYDVKQSFHNETQKLNAIITGVNERYKVIFQQNEDKPIPFIKALEEEKERYLESFEESRRDILDAFERALLKIDDTLDTLKSDYQSILNSITFRYRLDITEINKNRIKHQEALEDMFREKAKEMGIDDFDLDTINAQSASTDLKLAYQNQLKKINKTYDDEVTLREKRFFNDRLNHGFDYIQKREVIRESRVQQDQKRELLLKQNKTILDNRIKYVDEAIKLIHEEKRLTDRIIETMQSIELIPLDIQVLLARHIHDLELNYISTEETYRLERYENAIQEKYLEMEKRKIELEHNIEKSLIIFQNSVKLDELKNHLDMDLAQLKKNYDQRVLESELQIDILKHKKQQLIIKNRIEELELKANAEIRQHEQRNTLNVEELNLLLQNQLLKSNKVLDDSKRSFNYQTGRLTAKKTIEESRLEEAKQLKIIDNFFQSLYKLHIETSEMIASVHKAYYTLDVGDFSILINHFRDLFENQKNMRDKIIEELKHDAQNTIEAKINLLTLSKFQSEQAKIESRYEKEFSLIDSDVKQHRDKLKSLRDETSNLYYQNAYYEDENSDVKEKIENIKKDINELRWKKSVNKKQSLKTLRRIMDVDRQTLISNLAYIKMNQDRIMVIHKEIKAYDSYIKALESKRVTLSSIKQTEIDALREQQKLEGQVYYSLLQNLTSLERDFKKQSRALILEFHKALESLISKPLKERTFKNAFKRVERLLKKQKDDNDAFKKQFSKVFDKLYQNLVSKNEDVNAQFEKNYQLSKKANDKSYLLELKNLQEKLKQLGRNIQSLNNTYKRNLKKSLLHMKSKQIANLRNMDAQIHQESIHKEHIKQEFLSLRKAFMENKGQVVRAFERENVKEKRALELKYQQKMIHITNEIKKIKHVIHSIDSVFMNTLKTYDNHDIQTRSRLKSDRLTRYRLHNQDIRTLRRNIKEIGLTRDNNFTKTNKENDLIAVQTEKELKLYKRRRKRKLFYDIKRRKRRFRDSLT